MPTIIKKGTNDSAFHLKNGRDILIRVGAGGGDYLNILSEADFEMLMDEYGSFIFPRIINDKNPKGCFIINDKKSYAQDMGKEIGEEIKDNSAPLNVNKDKKIKKRK